MITDEAGTLLFRSREMPLSPSVRAALTAAAKEEKRGLISIGNRRTYVKEVSLQGRRHLFFLDFENLCTRFGTAADRAAAGLFDVSAFAQQAKKVVSLQVLCRLFLDCYAEALQKEGVRPDLCIPEKDLYVQIAPNAFVLCLALLIRLSAGEDGRAKIRFVRQCGRVQVFADGKGASTLSPGEREVLTMLLYEVSAAAGFAVDMQQRANGCFLSLALNPLDISLLGFKTEPFALYKNTMVCYIALFG